MGGLYVRNKLVESFCRIGVEDLPELEDDVSAEDIMVADVIESFETSLEDDWPEFIIDFYSE